MRYRTLLLTGLAIAPLGGAAIARQEPAPGRATIFQQVIDCRAIADNAARLACFDRSVASLDQAEKAKEVVVVDKAQMREARRTLFGLPLPNFHLFGGNEDTAADAVTQIESKIEVATPDADGWRVRLEDGTVWLQTDGKPMFRTPKKGLNAVVKRGALGSYVLRVENAPGVKVRRVL